MRILKFFVIFVGFVSLFGFSTRSVFVSRASINGNQFSTGNWVTPTPSPTTTGEQKNIVINEVYYDVDPSHGPQKKPGENYAPNANTNIEGMYEWAELYNPNLFPVLLDGWTIQSNDYWNGMSWQTCIKPISLTNNNIELAPGGFAVITPYVPTFRYFWGAETMGHYFTEIFLGHPFDCPSNPLGNDGDQLILKNAQGGIVDQVSWGNNAMAFSPSITDAIEGHSLVRKPAGFDTDRASDFIDQDNPTPGF